VLSDKEILVALEKRMLNIIPFSKERLTSAGYDFASLSATDLRLGSHKLISTLESIELSAQILATIHLKSSFAREGVIGSFAIIDPGYKGKLTLSVYNAGTSVIHIKENEPIVQVVFHRTGEPSTQPYNGKYQNSQEIIYSKRNVQSARKAHEGK
jgi:dCTP deaminase